MRMDEEKKKKLEEARRRTATAIAETAQAKHSLDEIRKKGVLVRPEAISQAAQEYRSKESVMKAAINDEISTIIQIATA